MGDLPALAGPRVDRRALRRRGLLGRDTGAASTAATATSGALRRHRAGGHLPARAVSRNPRHFTTLWERENKRAEIVPGPGMGNAAIGRLMLNVLGSFAEFERDLTASRIAEARAHLKAHGRRIAGAIPFGYAADPHTKQLEVCEEEASAVVRMFQWAAQGITPSVIASYANALRWITGAGKPWTARQVLSILSNHVYAGLVVHGFAFVEGCHPALIDRDTYHKVQNLIAARRTGVARQAWRTFGNHMDCPRVPHLREVRTVDEQPRRPIWTRHSPILSMSLNSGWPGAVQGCDGRGPRSRNRSPH